MLLLVTGAGGTVGHPRHISGQTQWPRPGDSSNSLRGSKVSCVPIGQMWHNPVFLLAETELGHRPECPHTAHCTIPDPAHYWHGRPIPGPVSCNIQGSNVNRPQHRQRDTALLRRRVFCWYSGTWETQTVLINIRNEDVWYSCSLMEFSIRNTIFVASISLFSYLGVSYWKQFCMSVKSNLSKFSNIC